MGLELSQKAFTLGDPSRWQQAQRIRVDPMMGFKNQKHQENKNRNKTPEIIRSTVVDTQRLNLMIFGIANGLKILGSQPPYGPSYGPRWFHLRSEVHPRTSGMLNIFRGFFGDPFFFSGTIHPSRSGVHLFFGLTRCFRALKQREGFIIFEFVQISTPSLNSFVSNFLMLLSRHFKFVSFIYHVSTKNRELSLITFPPSFLFCKAKNQEFSPPKFESTGGTRVLEKLKSSESRWKECWYQSYCRRKRLEKSLNDFEQHDFGEIECWLETCQLDLQFFFF